MGSEDEHADRWIGCLKCGQPLRICVGTRGVLMQCDGCGREWRYSAKQPEPAGGEIDGLPPFLANFADAESAEGDYSGYKPVVVRIAMGSE